MHEYKTLVEFLGEYRQALIGWDPVDECCWVKRVEVAMIVAHHWNAQGEPKEWDEVVTLDVRSILSDDQIYALAQEIKADRLAKAAEEYDDSRMMAAEERWCRMYGRRIAA